MKVYRMRCCGQLPSESQLYRKSTFFGELRLLYYLNFIIKEIQIRYACLLFV